MAGMTEARWARGLFGDLVHILWVRRCALGTVARRGRAASAFLGETFGLLFVALLLELLGFIHEPLTRTLRATRSG